MTYSIDALKKNRVSALLFGGTEADRRAIAVAATHRREALAACAHAIERLKETAPIWKKEHYAGSARWIEGPDPHESSS